jgi:hypothetical protein
MGLFKQSETEIMYKRLDKINRKHRRGDRLKRALFVIGIILAVIYVPYWVGLPLSRNLDGPPWVLGFGSIIVATVTILVSRALFYFIKDGAK